MGTIRSQRVGRGARSLIKIRPSSLMSDKKMLKEVVRKYIGTIVLSPVSDGKNKFYQVEGAARPFPQNDTVMPLVAPQGFEPRSSESESLVLPLNERAIQVLSAAAGSAGATISRLCECTGDEPTGQPLPPPSVHNPSRCRCATLREQFEGQLRTLPCRSHTALPPSTNTFASD
jgi:hypothetical protein